MSKVLNFVQSLGGNVMSTRKSDKTIFVRGDINALARKAKSKGGEQYKEFKQFKLSQS